MLEWAAERGDLRVLVAPARWPAAGAMTSFDRRHDWLEARPLPVRSQARDLAGDLTDTARLMKYLYESDRIWPRGWTDGSIRDAGEGALTFADPGGSKAEPSVAAGLQSNVTRGNGRRDR